MPITSVNVKHQRQHHQLRRPGSTASVDQARNRPQAAEARVTAAKANAIKSHLDVERYTPLVQKDVISKQQYDAAVATDASNQAAVLEAEANADRQPGAGNPGDAETLPVALSGRAVRQNRPQPGKRASRPRANAAHG